jgi:hypothetical protein
MMITARMSVLSVACCLLAGCANFSTTETGCEQSTQTYAELEACLKVAAEQLYTPRPAYTPELNLYLVKAVGVADSVRSNRRSEFEGRAELLRNYIALRQSKAGK